MILGVHVRYDTIDLEEAEGRRIPCQDWMQDLQVSTFPP